MALILSSVNLHEFCFNKYFYTEGPVIGNVEGDLGDLDLQAVEVDQDQGPVQTDQDQEADHDQYQDHLNNLLKGLDQGLDHDQIVLEVEVRVDQDLVQGN